MNVGIFQIHKEIHFNFGIFNQKISEFALIMVFEPVCHVTVKSRGLVFKPEREQLLKGETTIFKQYRCGPFVSMHLRQMSK